MLMRWALLFRCFCCCYALLIFSDLYIFDIRERLRTNYTIEYLYESQSLYKQRFMFCCRRLAWEACFAFLKEIY